MPKQLQPAMQHDLRMRAIDPTYHQSRYNLMQSITFCLAILALAFAGCEKKDPRVAYMEDFQANIEEVKVEALQQIERDMAEKAKIVCEESRSLLPATSKEQLANAYTLAFDAGDITAMKQMAHIEHDDRGESEQFLRSLGTYTAKSKHVSKITFVPLADDDKSRFPTLTPVAIAKVLTKPNGPYGWPSTSEHAVVEVDGKFWFYLSKMSLKKDQQVEETAGANGEIGHQAPK